MEIKTLDKLLKYFDGLDPKHLPAVSNFLQEKKYSTNQYIIKEGDINRTIGLINYGLVRVFHATPDGEDYTIMVRWEGQFVKNYDAIINNLPSRFNCQCLEDTSLITIDYDILLSYIKENPNLIELNNRVLYDLYFESLQRVENFIMLSPEERYINLLRQNPEIDLRLSDKYIATMLGITPVSLSRIKRRIKNINNFIDL